MAGNAGGSKDPFGGPALLQQLCWKRLADEIHMTLGASDEFGFNVTEDPVHVHDLHATLLHLLGFDHTKLSVKFQGLNMRLTGIAGELVPKLLA